MRTLVLNADFIPLNLVPLSTISWQEAICLIVKDKATAIENYDREIRSPSITMPMPSVIVLKEYAYFKKIAKLNKYNVKLRDEFVCQYCGTPHTHKSLTVDHVVPKSQGGKYIWTNLTTACRPCNSSKGDNKHIVPKKKPKKVTYYQLAKKLLKHEKITNAHWNQYLTRLQSS